MSTIRSSALQKLPSLWLLLLQLFGVTNVVFSFALFVPCPCNHNPPRTITSSLSLSSLQHDNNNNGDGTIIQVFDNVFSQEICHELLHPLAVDHADRCTSSVFYRNNKNSNDNTTILTPLEVTLDRLLTALEERDNQFNNNNNLNNSYTNRVTAVEYWSRQEHLHMDVHCDVDEGQLEQEGTLRYPSYSHVLYLKLQSNTQKQQQRQIQQKHPNQKCTLPAPTCIILTDDPAKSVVRGEVESHHHHEDAYESTATTEPTNLVTVPAVVGRLLRFPGNLLHAVPKPYDRWLEQLDGHDVKAILPSEDDMDDYDDDDDDDDDDSLRSVLLFNTWEDRGPLEVGPDSFATATNLEGIEMDEDMMAYLAQEQATRIADWQHDFGGVEFDLLNCNPIQKWVDCHPVALAGATRDATAMSEVRMSLMRKESGQRNSKQQISLYGSSSDVREALEQGSLVSKIQLQSNQKS